MTLLQILNGDLFREDKQSHLPGNPSETELYHVLLAELGADFAKVNFPARHNAFQITHSKASIKSMTALLHLAHYYQNQKDTKSCLLTTHYLALPNSDKKLTQQAHPVLKEKSSQEKYVFCLALLYSYAQFKRNEKMYLPARGELLAFLDKNTHFSSAEIESVRALLAAPTSFFNHHDKEFIDDAAQVKNLQNILLNISRKPVEAKASKRTIIETRINTKKAKKPTDENRLAKQKREIRTLFSEEIHSKSSFNLAGLSALLKEMVTIQKNGTSEGPFQQVRLEQKLHKGTQGNTQTWQSMMSELKTRVLEELKLAYPLPTLPQSIYDEYYQLFNTHTAHARLFTIRDTRHAADFKHHFSSTKAPRPATSPRKIANV